ncbi:MAG: DUF1592 domain-containing protein [Planctomycetota bacterium]|nr:DUF1592 domain-containing protein [Planctomycetota bacterium]
MFVISSIPLRGVVLAVGAFLTTALACRADDSAAPDFATSGAVFLQTYCNGCHGSDEPEADLSLTAFTNSKSLISQRKAWDSVLRALSSGVMPPPDEKQPTPDEVAAFKKLVEAIFDHHDRTAPPDPGRVTMRRLNRNEYNNTIRDLVGVDFAPAEDFPSDDIGHGFDNIGAVLTLPPVLMERYLAAAEGIVERAIIPNPPAPPRRVISARYCEPAGKDVPTTRYRPISTKTDGSPIETGPLFTRYKIPPGEYIFRTKVFAEAADGQTVKLAVLACTSDVTSQSANDEIAATISGKAVDSCRPFVLIDTVEVTARNEKDPQSIEVQIPRIEGFNRVAVGMVKSSNEGVDSKLHIEFLALEGPKDTRPDSHHNLLACRSDASSNEKSREVLTRFATRAYRRPVAEAEVERLLTLARSVEEGGAKWEEAMQFAMQAVLVSPKFLFRVELDQNSADGAVAPLDDFQLASRLSYFLWSSMPDEQLFELARENKLRAALGEQIRRMLLDPKADALVENFALQWLQVKRLETFAPDPEKFSYFNSRLRRAMLEETRLFFAAVMREDRSVMELLAGDFTFLNQDLSRHYNIGDTNGNPLYGKPTREKGEPIRDREFVRVSLPADSVRGGLVTQSSILAVTSNPTRTSPVKRGKWVLEQLLGTPPPPPPPNVPELEDAGQELTGSLRERMEQHRTNPACAACHRSMDSLGFALENFDPLGRWRDKDGEHAVDPSGKLPGGESFAGPAELKTILLSKRELFARCLTEKMLTYALGRGLEYYDRPAVNRIVKSIEKDEYRFSALVEGIVTSEPFVNRRGK